MIFIGLLKWWYGVGWQGVLNRQLLGLRVTADYFSIGLLLKTLFSPFRQIGSDETSREAGGKFNLFIDKLISRSIGAVVRLMTIIGGTVCLLFRLIFGIICLAIWPMLPLSPVFGLILTVVVGAPWKLI